MTAERHSEQFDVVVVGAGFAGLYALHLLRKLGFRVKVLETGRDIGGTWFWNRYPGARCDAQSLVYSYSFDDALRRDWKWTEHYAKQPEILSYLQFVADRLDLRRDISLQTRVVWARYNSNPVGWHLKTSDGREFAAQFVVMATGPLSAGHIPDIQGINKFQGQILHTGIWPDATPAFDGRRVAVVGTGSSGVQVIPIVAKVAAELTVFQRTPAFVLPARSRTVSVSEHQRFVERLDHYKAAARRGDISGIGDVLLSDHLPPPQRAEEMSESEQTALMERRWAVGGVNIWKSFKDPAINPATNEILANFIRKKIREIVQDKKTAERLTPRGFPFGAKRPCVGTEYYESFNRENVRLIDLNEMPIAHLDDRGVVTSDGRIEVDTIIFATGFDAMTGALSRIAIEDGVGGSLREVWKGGASSYLGVSIAGFPNLFTICGPGSPAVLGNVVVNIEQHVEWISRLLQHARANGIMRIEADPDAQTAWMDEIAEAAGRLLTAQANSWYVGANIPGKARRYLPYPKGIAAYRQELERVAASGYCGFNFAVCHRSQKSNQKGYI